MAYRTASANCLEILTGIPPTDLLMEEKFRRSLKNENFVEIHDDILNEWCDRWRNNPGDSWCKQLIPDPESWLRRNYGYPYFWLTQLFTGHGIFGSYLFRFKKTDSNNCKLCITERDTPEHIFFSCSRFINKKRMLDLELDTTLTPKNFQTAILKNPTNWNLIQKYVKDILTTKSPLYQNQPLPNPPPPPSAEDIPDGNSGVSREVNS
ncbi:uncharacterized protein [Bemisia tabaci]|uniref:uncharacterized protein n=1 Tax=Bemisia tabaci TaxID=7038 RepID=UPI003B28242A